VRKYTADYNACFNRGDRKWSETAPISIGQLGLKSESLWIFPYLNFLSDFEFNECL
jgi:hypothetical protein